MIAGGADLKSVNRFGGTALLPSSEKGYLKTVEVCIDAGVPVNHVNDLGWSALLEAVILGNGGRLYSDIIKALVHAGADVHLPDRDGLSSLQRAEENGQHKVVKILEQSFQENNEYVKQAKALANNDQYEEAISVINRALEVDADNLDFIYYKGYFLQELKRYEEALRCYESAISIDSANLEFYFYTANCLRLWKKPEEALQEYDKACELAPNETFYRYHKSNYLRELGRHQEAVIEMDKLLALQPNRYDFSFHKANSLRSLGKHKEAIEAIENAIKNDPTNPLYHSHKKQSLELLG